MAKKRRKYSQPRAKKVKAKRGRRSTYAVGLTYFKKLKKATPAAQKAVLGFLRKAVKKAEAFARGK